jgi:transcription antitermination factor NusG
VLSPDIALWFAVQVIPQHECKVASQLRYKGQEEFLPMVSSRRQWSDRSKVSERPLFPGYVFCRVKRSSFGVVLDTPGVHRIVSFGGHAHPIADEEISSLQHVLVSGRDVASVPYLTLGQRVKVIDGPLFGVTGIVMRVKNRNRLLISVDMLMRSIAVEVSLGELSACDPSHQSLTTQSTCGAGESVNHSNSNVSL